MRVTSELAKIEQNWQDNSVRRDEKRGRLTEVARTRGPTRTQPSGLMTATRHPPHEILDQQAKSGDLALIRQTEWGMSAHMKYRFGGRKNFMAIYVDQEDLASGDPNETLATASVVSIDYFTVAQPPIFGVADPNAPTVSIQGSLDFANEVDVFAFEVLTDDVGNVTLTFDIDFAQGGLDSIIGLFDPNGVVVAGSDDYNVGFSPDSGSSTTLDSYMTYVPTVAGTYYIAVASYGNIWPNGPASGGLSTGAYTLNVSISGAIGVQDYGNGSSGSDNLFGDRQGVVTNDRLNGYAGNDDISGDAGDDTLIGGDGQDNLYGGSGNDVFYGDQTVLVSDGGLYTIPEEGPGNEDVIYGGDNNDFLLGERGNDTLFGDADDDTLEGGTGNDKLWGGAGTDSIWGESGADSLYGGAGNDAMYGGFDVDVLLSSSGNDSLNGGDGNDRLNGGTGSDSLAGGSGSDAFVFSSIKDSRPSLANCDVILDFSTIEHDRIDLRGIDANSVGGGANDAFSQVILRSGPFTAPGQIKITQVGADTIVYLNTDDDTAADSIIILRSVIDFTVTDLNFLF